MQDLNNTTFNTNQPINRAKIDDLIVTTLDNQTFLTVVATDSDSTRHQIRLTKPEVDLLELASGGIRKGGLISVKHQNHSTHYAILNLFNEVKV
jgi:hypothetical protein